MTIVHDARGNRPLDSTGSRRKFLDRYKGHIKKAVERSIGEQSIRDIGTKGGDVVIPKRDIREPSIHHGDGGYDDRVLPGNKEHVPGDTIYRPRGGGGGGGGTDAGDGDSEDDFIYKMSADDIEAHIFADLELPNMTKRALSNSNKTRPSRAGYTYSGAEQDRHFVQSKKEKMKRMVASVGPINEEILHLLEEKQDILARASGPQERKIYPTWTPRKIRIKALEAEIEGLMKTQFELLTDEEQSRVIDIDEMIEDARKRISLVPSFNESTDSRYRGRSKKPVPISKAVMFCLMDVSASMDEEKKNNAKLFYFLLYRFLRRHYEQTEVVFIRHTTHADEVDEKTFFEDPESGGTLVSSGLEKMIEVMRRFPESEWNIYGAQASDGDNYRADNAKCVSLLTDILPKFQGYFYTELPHYEHQELWAAYQALAEKFNDRFWMATILDRPDVPKVFRELFKKRESSPAPGVTAWSPG